MLRVGFIGTGVIFNLNVLGYLHNDDTDIVALCNRTIQKAKDKIKKFNLAENIQIYSDYREMIKDEDIDLLEILLPHHLHAEATIYAAGHGVKVISVQKPMAMTLKEANEMIKACNDSGAILSIYENFIFAPHIRKAKELLDQDYIGDITSIRIKVAMGGSGGWQTPQSAQEWRLDPKIVGGGSKGSPVLFDNGWHAFALARWLVNEEIDKVFAWTGSFKGIDTPAYVVFKYNQSKEHVVPQYGQMEFSYLPEMKISSPYYSTDEFIEIIATRGIMRINQGTAIGNNMTKSDIFAPIIIIRDGKVENYNDFNTDWNQSFINATKHLIEVAKNKKEPILSGYDAKKVLKFNLAAINSVEQKKEIRLDDFS
ncbi:MAG: Gfo/Idh/MocA family oxidoreductase [Promethearchaeota archaeon]|nr:MAG: Gfo/Idh/MocA family oxidoreductase [Candidatus Lokiarchaeota archaeon]